MKKMIINYLGVLIIGIILGGGIYYLFLDNSANTEHDHSKTEQLYSCGMHPQIVEKEPGTCPICGMNLTPIKNNSGSKTTKSGERKILYWRAPMNPNEVYDQPGKSQMGMDLVPVYEDEGGASGVVTVDGSVLQSMNVKMDYVTARKLSSRIFTNGNLVTDETKEFSLTTKMDGWIENLYINFIGQNVRKGQKLVDIYSPELFAAQQEVITALSYDSGQLKSNMLENAIKKLELFDIDRKEIDELISTKKIKKYVTLFAPFNGTVITKEILKGDKIKAGNEIMKIADLTNLWLNADVYESDLSKIQLGNKAEIVFSYKPEKTYTGKVSFIYPTVNPVTRTVKVRIDLKNYNQELKPSMFGNVEIFGKESGEVLTVAETAILRSGKNNLVILSLGEGKFKPVNVKLGQYSDGYYQILSGLKLNDVIVKSGQFMIDSESSLRSAVDLFSSSKDEKPATNEAMSEEEMKNMKLKQLSEEEHIHSEDDSIVRRGVIDVEAIDKNSDGKVFQDMMDWNVISDEEGKCPICGMNLKEVTIDEAKNNLKENGFKYK